MLIKSIILKKYKSFNFSEIDKLTIDFVSLITVIVGTNGSGKTSLLRMLNPLPPVRTDFYTGGYKELKIEHEGSEYILISDFNNRTSPHSFIKDGIELNVSGTTSVQEELVIKHLQYTNQINSLLHLNVNICHMSRAERKNYFISLNPVDLSLILDIHKKTLSKLKEYKNNLAHLYKRKEEIEHDLLSKDMLSQMRINKSKLDLQNTTLDKAIYSLYQYLETLKKKPYSNNVDLEYTLDKYKTHIRNTIIQSSKFQEVDRENYLTHIKELETIIINLESNITNTQQQIKELNTEISEYRTHITTTSSKSIQELEEEIAQLNKQINEIQVIENQSNIPILKEEHISNFSFIIEYFKDKTNILMLKEFQSFIFTSSQLYRLQSKIDLLNYKTNQYKNEIVRLEEDIKQQEQDKNKFNLTIPDNCTFEDCTLKIRYTNNKDKIDTNINKLQLQIQKTQEILTKKHAILLKLQEIYNAQHGYSKLIDELVNKWNRDTYLNQILVIKDLIYYLNKNPKYLINLLNNVILNSEKYWHRQKYIDKKELLTKELQSLHKNTNTSHLFIEKLILEKTDKLHNLLDKLQTESISLKDNYIKKNILDSFITLKESNKIKYEEFIDEISFIINSKQIEHYTTLLNCLEDVKIDINDELRNLDLILREQDNLISRYDEEIIKQINTIEEQKHKYRGIEKVVSPNTGYPHKHLVNFLNGLIHNVNYFVSQVFSYPLSVIKLNPEEPIDFALRVNVGGTKVDDVSCLSKSQQEIMNLAWTFTILLQKKMLDKYPLFLDEFGGSFDTVHQITMLEFLKDLHEKKIINQMFTINHQAIYSDGFTNSDVICLKPNDSILVDNMNQYVKIE